MSNTETSTVGFWLKLVALTVISGVLANGAMVYAMKTDIAVIQNDISYIQKDIKQLEEK